MRSLKPRKSLLQGISPWQSKKQDDDQNQMTQFCHQMLPRLKQQPSLCQKINEQFNKNIAITQQPQPSQIQQIQQIQQIKIRTRRPNSNVQSTRQGNQRISIFDRLPISINQQNRDMKSAQKPSHPQMRFQLQPLQEISVRNYIIEGSRQNCKQPLIRKKQSSYIMKQKFAQIRRSMNLQLGIWGSIHRTSANSTITNHMNMNTNTNQSQNLNLNLDTTLNTNTNTNVNRNNHNGYGNSNLNLNLNTNMNKDKDNNKNQNKQNVMMIKYVRYEVN